MAVKLCCLSSDFCHPSGEKIIKVVLSFTIPSWVEGPIVWLALLYRRIRYGYAFRRIPLTRGKYAIVDPDDFERLSAHKWHAFKSKHTFYAERAVRVEGGRQVIIKMHREILKVPDGMLLDHINHNGLDNRKANLRPATSAENNRNRRKSIKRKCHSKFKGVSWNVDQKKWSARICFNSDMKFIGYFNDEMEAAKAYDKAAIKYHGESESENVPASSNRMLWLRRNGGYKTWLAT